MEPPVRGWVGQHGVQVLLGGLQIEAARTLLAFRGHLLRGRRQSAVDEKFDLRELGDSGLEREPGLGGRNRADRVLDSGVEFERARRVGPRLRAGDSDLQALLVQR